MGKDNSDQLNQAEIDQILQALEGGETSFDINQKVAAASIDNARKAKDVKACIERYYFAMAAKEDLYKIKEARRDLHIAGFSLWCSNRGISKDEYYSIMKKEMKKRGLRYVSSNPSGYKLVRIG
jgi:hypothetical protein